MVTEIRVEEIVESAFAACVYTHMYLHMFMCMCVYIYICIFIYIKETNEFAKEKCVYIYIYIIHPFALPKKLRAVPLFLSLSLTCRLFRV